MLLHDGNTAAASHSVGKAKEPEALVLIQLFELAKSLTELGFSPMCLLCKRCGNKVASLRGKKPNEHQFPSLLLSEFEVSSLL